MDSDEMTVILQQDRESTRSLRDQLRRDLDDVFAASADVATDDEHDPEGATIAYERSRTNALLEQAEARLTAIDQALGRLEAGSYGRCVGCGEAIGIDRLRARPVVLTCITCAAR